MRSHHSLFALAFVSAFALAQAPPPPQNAPEIVAGIPVNYDESKVGEYVLPDALKFNDDKPVRDANTWWKKRRPASASKPAHAA